MGRYIVGIAGVSGSIYVRQVMERLIQKGHHVCICMAQAGELVVESELGWQIGQDTPSGEVEQYLQEVLGSKESTYHYDVHAIGAPIASESPGMDAIIVVLCSMGTLFAICHGSSHNLLERAADICLKERRPLVTVPRETPYNQIYLENMTKLSGYGTVIMSASPGFYSRPRTIEEMVDFFVTRTLGQMGIHKPSESRWMGMDVCVKQIGLRPVIRRPEQRVPGSLRQRFFLGLTG